ncbi:MAG: DNA-processing protein DprA [Candidatus Kapabacteria bacterium]|nr:DNA-processing protein DprA [Candidatus Kapabacteria bacterium]
MVVPPLPDGWSRQDILALALVRGLASVDIRTAVEECPSLEAAMAHPPPRMEKRLRQEHLFDPLQPEELRRRAQEHSERLAALNARAVTFWDDDYPALLREIPYPPVVLYVQGTLQPADALAIAIVGTRRCTTYGKLCAERFASEIARAGCIVVSGLATGIDSIAHTATLEAGGITYAVIGSGLDRLAPTSARRLAEHIVRTGGAVLSEYPLGTVARPGYFPQRNRIISGIARAVLVVESRRTGGSLITAQFALDQSRELFAVPGSILAPTSEGTNLLIAQQKAQAAVSPELLLAELGVQPSAAPQQPTLQFESPLEEQLWQQLSSEPQHVDDIAAAVGMSIGEVLGALLMMEFRGMVRQLPGKMFIRAVAE